MAEVIKLAEHKPKPVKPKSISDTHAGQRYTCTYDPNAPDGEQWVWEVNFVRTYRYWGASPTAESAASTARRRIHALVKRQQDWDEKNG